MASEYVSTKRTMLSSPGRSLNTMYYNQLSLDVSSVEAMYTTGRYKTSLNSTAFGSSAQCTIPNASFLGTTYLSASLPALVANQALPRGWLYHAIDSLEFLVGSSNVSLLRMDGKSVLQVVMAQCCTEERRNEIYRLAGEEITTAGVIPEGVCILPLPWSTLCGYMQKKELDTNVLNNPITVRINFVQNNRLYGGSGARPVGFDRLEVLTRQADLDNKANSLANMLKNNEALQLGYPFIHFQSYQVPFSTAIANERAFLELKSFINADLTMIALSAIKRTDVIPVANNSPNPMNSVDLKNIILRYNGQTMFDLPGDMGKLTNLHSIDGAGFFHNSVILPGATAPFSSQPVDTYIYCLDFSRIRAACWEQEYQNTPRFAQQVFTLEFDIADADDYILYTTYFYNGIMELSGGVSQIFFN